MECHRPITARSTRLVGIALALALVLPGGVAAARSASKTTSLDSVSATTDSASTSSVVIPDAATTPYEVARAIGLIDKKGGPLVAGTGKGVTIAMIDTGVAPVAGLANSHVILGPDFSPEDMFDDLRSLDTNGHGTHLAGIMVGTDAAWSSGDHRRTADRILGVAPDATLLSIKAGTADGGTDITQVIAAINWVIGQKESGTTDIDILSLAFSADSAQTYYTDPLTYAVERAWKAGIVVVVAGGNEGQDQWRLTSPARDPFVIAVGASELTKKATTEAQYTSKGILRPVDIHAPGTSILSYRDPGSWSDQFNGAGRVGEDLVRGTGTSQATAVVAGAVAVLLENRPDLSPDEVKAILRDGATIVDSGDFSWPLRFLDLATSMGSTAPTAKQWYPSAIGSGSIDSVRGELRPTIDGIALAGEIDIFGNDWSGSRWTLDAWSGSRWTGSRWTSDLWAGATWAGSRWTTTEWTGSRWTGSRWTATDWSSSRWTGSRWTGSRWTGADWS